MEIWEAQVCSRAVYVVCNSFKLFIQNSQRFINGKGGSSNWTAIKNLPYTIHHTPKFPKYHAFYVIYFETKMNNIVNTSAF